MIKFKQKGDFSKTTKYFKKLRFFTHNIDFDKYGREGVTALKAATPVESGETRDSWYYEIIKKDGNVKISFNNKNIQNGVPIAIILQYGHATRNGGWVEGRDYINPTIQPIFDGIATKAWKEVTKQ